MLDLENVEFHHLPPKPLSHLLRVPLGLDGLDDPDHSLEHWTGRACQQSATHEEDKTGPMVEPAARGSLASTHFDPVPLPLHRRLPFCEPHSSLRRRLFLFIMFSPSGHGPRAAPVRSRRPKDSVATPPPTPVYSRGSLAGTPTTTTASGRRRTCSRTGAGGSRFSRCPAKESRSPRLQKPGRVQECDALPVRPSERPKETRSLSAAGPRRRK